MLRVASGKDFSMRLLTLALLAGLVACSPASKNENPTTSAVNGPDALEGQYQIGDRTWEIVPVKMAYEMRKEPGAEPVMLFGQPSEVDTISVYANSDQTIRLKMYPGHSRGTYYEADKPWEVIRTGLLETPAGETEAEETERLAQEQTANEATTEETYSLYNGNYQLYTESEGATGALQLTYLANKKFEFEIRLDVPDVCNGNVKGEFVFDQPDFGSFRSTTCPLTLTLKGSGNGGMIVQIEQSGTCASLGESCVFTGTYVGARP